MFKSIKYKLGYHSILMLTFSAGATWLFVSGRYFFAVFAAIVALTSLKAVYGQFRKFNSNIILLLNALENGDFSFHFSETKMSVREREMNMVMNRIRKILINAREEVIEKEKFLSIIVETVPVGIIIMDERGSITTVNRIVLQWLGLPGLVHTNQLRIVNESFPEIFLGLRPGSSTQINLFNEREELQISMRATEVNFRYGSRKLISLNSIGNELESMEIESWIRLIRVMTHEIMNSIAPITSLSDTMLYILQSEASSDGKDLQKNAIEAFETISTTAKGLSSFVESYRKFTAVPQPVKKPFPLRETLVQAVNLNTQAAAEKNISINIVPQDDLELYADKNLIMQVLLNLLKNAIEAANENGEIQINYHLNRNGKTVIDIINSGQLIPKDILPFIFIPFFTTKENGNGVGLSVSRYIMRLHGGNLQHSVSANKMTAFSMLFL